MSTDNAQTEEPEAMTEEAANQAAEAMAGSGTFGDLDKVRQILFGGDRQELDQRIGRLEEHLERQLEALQAAVGQRFEALEASIHEQNEALHKRLADEEKQRGKDDGKLSGALENLAETLKEHRLQLDQNIEENVAALRGQLHDQASAASQDVEQRFEALTARLEQAVAELGEAKTDRHGLADLFAELSGRLRNTDS